MADFDSSAGEDRARFKFVSWCTRCGHQFRTKQHALRHLARCPPPHELRCGCCGVHYNWTDFVQHVNVKGVCRRRQRCYLPPLPSEPRFNISCCSPPQSLPLSRPDAFTLAAPAAVAASPLSYASVSLISSASLTSPPLRSPATIAEPSARRFCAACGRPPRDGRTCSSRTLARAGSVGRHGIDCATRDR